ncbi:MAG: hypothetical protein EOO54_06175 [Haliea sp.]|nr:MAG: hypothetical protein EOO54_06175 [Haliea sp.]
MDDCDAGGTVKSIWTPTLAWLAAVAAAFLLAVAAPSELTVMGRLPSLTANQPGHRTIALPDGLPARPTLALVAFAHSHRGEIDSWIQGLNLNRDNSIAWLKMPVLSDPGSATARKAALDRLFARHSDRTDSTRLLPVFADPYAFVRTAGLSGVEHAGILVLGRDGRVLARVEGHFDETKAQALRETLLAQYN